MRSKTSISHIKTILLSAVFLIVFNLGFSQTHTIDRKWWFPNGQVSAIQKDTANNLVYLGGSFSMVGPYRVGGVGFDSLGYPNLGSDTLNGRVRKSIADGTGGKFIAGRFTQVGNKTKYGIAQLDALGNATNLFGSKGFNGEVKDLKKKGDSLFVGGTFTNYGFNKSNFAICDTGSAVMDSLSLNFSDQYSSINAIISDSNGGWYVGGVFSTVGEGKRVNFAHIKSNGTLGSTRLNVKGTIYSLELIDGKLYIGGLFDEIGNKSRNNLARVDTSTMLVDSWNPNVNSEVFTIKGSGGNIYIGGSFSSVGGLTRNNLAAINNSTGISTSWNPSPNGTVRCLVISGNDIVIGGEFQKVGTTNRAYIAKLDRTYGYIIGWNAYCGNDVLAIYKDGTKLYVGGKFTNIGGQARRYAACLNYTSALATTWNPRFNDDVKCILPINNKVVIGGEFTEVGTAGSVTWESVDHIVAVDNNAGLKLNFDIYSSYNVNCLSHNGSKLAVGAFISNLNNTKISGVAVLSCSTGNLLNWSVDVRNRVNAIEIVNDTLFIAGDLQGGSLIACNASSGVKLIWTSWIFTEVYCLEKYNESLIVGSSGSDDLLKIKRSTRVKTILNNTNGKVYSFYVDGDQLFFGGDFTTVTGGATRNNIAKMNLSNHVLSNWNPNANEPVNTMIGYNDKLLIGGEFTSLGSTSIKYLADIDTVNGALGSWKSLPNRQIYSIEKYGDSLYVGGDFTSIGQMERNNLCALNAITGKLTSWNPGPNGDVFDLELLDSSLVVSGNYTAIGGFNRNYLAKVNTNTLNVTSWNPNPNNRCFDIKMDSVNIYACGLFSTVGGQSYSKLVKISKSSGVTSNWQPFGSTSNSYCFEMDIRNDTLLVGGSFSSIGGQTRNNLAMINTGTGAVNSWNVNTNITVTEVSLIDSSVFACGNFTSSSSVTTYKGLRFRTSDGAVQTWNRDTLKTEVYSVKKFKGLIYEGGSEPIPFVGNGRPSVSSYNPFSNVADNWNPNLNGITVIEIHDLGGQLSIGGLINYVDDDWVSNFAVFNTCFDLTVDTVKACSVYTWIDGVTYDTNNYEAQFILDNSAGCDSIITLNLTMQSNSYTDVQSVCDSLVWIDGNTYFSNDTTSTYVLVNSFGCDSLVTLNLEILQDSVTDYRTTCDSLIWIDGITYFESIDSVFWTINNVHGCDSTIRLIYTKNATSSIDSLVACDSLTWLDGNTYYVSNNSATWTGTNVLGCDSVINLDLVINYSDTTLDSYTVCDSLTWIDGNTYFANTDSVFMIFTNVLGCDSVLQLDLEIQGDSIIDYHSNCDSLNWINGNTYYQSTDSVFWTGTNVYGCDSIIQLVYQMNSSSSVDFQSACDSLTWLDGNTYNSDNNLASTTFVNSHGCDSIIMLDLIINESVVIKDSITACDSITWRDGVNYSSSNNSAIWLLNNPNGCDTIVRLNLTINSVDTSINTSLNTISSNAVGANYQWLDCTNGSAVIIPGENSSSFTAFQSGSYSVEVSENGCVDTSSCKTLTNVGMLENTLSQSYTIYPNPSYGNVVIAFEVAVNQLTMDLYSIDGKLISSVVKQNRVEFELEITGPPGTFILELSDDLGGKSMIKLIKK